jgi:hypothetical protein
MRQCASGSKGIETDLPIQRLCTGHDPGTFLEQLSQGRFPVQAPDYLLASQGDNSQNLILLQRLRQAAKPCPVDDDPIYFASTWRAWWVDHLVQGQGAGPVAELNLLGRTSLGNVPGYRRRQHPDIGTNLL